MSIVAVVLVALVALLHLYILVLEMFLWTDPRGQKAFGTTPEFAQQTKVLAANQGLYNGFLAAGLIWSILHPQPEFGWQIAMFFLACVAVAVAVLLLLPSVVAATVAQRQAGTGGPA